MKGALLFLFIFIGTMAYSQTYKDLTPPDAEQIPVEFTEHGNTRIDNYFWLKERGTDKVIEYLEAENEYMKKSLAHTEEMQEKLYTEMRERIIEKDESAPYFKDGFYYYTRYEEGKEYPIYCRKANSLDNEEQIILDVNALAEGYDFFGVSGLTVSPNSNILSFGVDTTGMRKYTIRFKNLETGEYFNDEIPNTNATSVWANDNKTVFYIIKDETLRPYKIFKHYLGEDADDELYYHEKDSTYVIGMWRSHSDQMLFITCWSTLSTEMLYIDPNNIEQINVLHPREADHQYFAEYVDGAFYIRSNKNAKNFRLMKTLLTNTSYENWETVIPHKEDVYLEDFLLFDDFVATQERTGGVTKLHVLDRNSDSDYYIEFDEDAYVTNFDVNVRCNTSTLRYGYSSLTTPYSVYDYDMATKERTLVKMREVGGEFNPEDYVTERLWADARDGEKVPISLVYKKGIEKNGDNPLLLYAYGAYGYTIDPYFSSKRLSLLDRGFVYAIAHIRGGSILGREWYEDGKMLNKKNTYYDYIDCAKYLIQEGYTSSEKIFGEGGSAGGLLMGAVLNMAPELFKGIIAEVPFVDVITTMFDESIPLTTQEWKEWGNPNIKEEYDYILTYSPYDNVEAKDYPTIFVTTAYEDSQVMYWEPAKWVAKLRDLKTDDNPLYFYTEMAGGHGGKSGRFQSLTIDAMLYAFMFDLLGIEQ